MRSSRGFSAGDFRVAHDAEKENLLNNDSDSEEEVLMNRTSSAEGQLHIDGKLSSVHIQIKEVTNVMRDNMHKMMNRGERLDDLQMASDRLSTAGTEFREAARKAQRRAWFQTMQTRFIIALIGITIIICIVVLDILALYLVLR